MSTIGEFEDEKARHDPSMTSVNNVVIAKLPKISLSHCKAWQPGMWF